MTDSIRQIDANQLETTSFKNAYVSCVVITQDQKILLQQRGEGWQRFPGYLCTFGGRIESNETPMQALIRELKERRSADL